MAKDEMAELVKLAKAAGKASVSPKKKKKRRSRTRYHSLVGTVSGLVLADQFVDFAQLEKAANALMGGNWSGFADRIQRSILHAKHDGKIIATAGMGAIVLPRLVPPSANIHLKVYAGQGVKIF